MINPAVHCALFSRHWELGDREKEKLQRTGGEYNEIMQKLSHRDVTYNVHIPLNYFCFQLSNYVI